MFSVAYVILPFSQTPPAEAIHASLARFQRGCRGDLPDEWLAFEDETAEVREAHEARFTFTKGNSGGMQIKGGETWKLDLGKVSDQMRRRRLKSWTVRFADEMSLDEFFERFARSAERHSETGAFGRWLNPIGYWDWWDLGGSYDGRIVGEKARMRGRRKAQVSSGASQGRSVLRRLQDVLADALEQESIPELHVHTDQNIELASTLLEDVRADRDNAYPGSLVLPPGSAEDPLRWVHTWPETGPEEAFAWLGLPADASWQAICAAVYARFHDHWVAAVAYHF